MRKILEGQGSLFKDSQPDTWFGKMCRALSAATGEEISEQCLLSASESKNQKLPMFLYLKKEDGPQPELSWETASLSLGESTMLSTGASPKDGNASLWCATSMDYLPQKSCLSAILEQDVDAKYYLSKKACLGILTRAKRRGKELPTELKEALLSQAETDEESFLKYYAETQEA